ncbi:MAG TPA: glycosyltransferase, partial [Puia sp.]|nr:glycosyltransferase [Puia sp.]
MKIPRILNQTWKDHDVPADFKEMADSWRKMHADWQYVLWTDEMNRNFVRQHFPYFLPTYDGYETNIQRVDAVRYFVLYKMGGFFIDLDFECLANIEPILANAECVFGKE